MSKNTDITHFNGENIAFSIKRVKNDSKDFSKQLIGKNVQFHITNVGKWTWGDKKQTICMICKLSLKADQDLVQCPMCQSPFHKEHIIEWLKVRGKCPVCQQNLLQASLERIKL